MAKSDKTKASPTKVTEKRVNRILTNLVGIARSASKLTAAQRKAVAGALEAAHKATSQALANPTQAKSEGFQLGD